MRGTGDNIGYLIGNKIGGWERFKCLREGRGRPAVDAADRGLQKRALVFLMTARYIPFGRTAVNLVAGAVHYPHSRFWPRSPPSTFAVGGVAHGAIGALAGRSFEHNHLLGRVALIAAMAPSCVEIMISIGTAPWGRAEQREAEQALVHQEHSPPSRERETAADGQEPGPVDQRPSPAATGGVESPSTPRGEESPA